MYLLLQWHRNVQLLAVIVESYSDYNSYSVYAV